MSVKLKVITLVNHKAQHSEPVKTKRNNLYNAAD